MFSQDQDFLIEAHYRQNAGIPFDLIVDDVEGDWLEQWGEEDPKAAPEKLHE